MLHTLAFMMLIYTISLPWLALIICDKISEARRLTIIFGVGMNVSMWSIYALIGLGRLAFGLPFIF